ncbi:rod shape-determining protein MreD [Olsenella uli]|uniref:rod shape-determining protein MreD n=1 Tax=Olsenella uli TaxID=133926 RepID=UPI00195D534D|nr:rod shape-determining protein MreD [Olsenella uli]MBM6675182.1 rod shape-determining protein MreD [Olsenella uli]
MRVADRGRESRTTVVMAVLCLVFQLTLAPNVALGNGRANFALVFTVCYALFSGRGGAPVAGFLAGLLFDLSSTGPIGLMAFCLTVAGALLGMSARERLAGDLASSVVHAAAVSLGVSVVYHLAMLLVGQASSLVDVLFLRALPTALLTVVFFLPFAYYFSRVRTHGSGLGGGRPRGGSLGRHGL